MVEIRRSEIHGRSTFSTDRIATGEVVEVWGDRAGGEKTVIYTSDLDAVELARRVGKVAMQWDDGLFSIEDKGADDGYYLNHSCGSTLGSRTRSRLSRAARSRPATK